MSARRLPSAPQEYSQRYTADLVEELRRLELRTVHTDRDNDFGDSGAIVLRSADGKRWRIGVDNLGALSTTEIT